MMMLRRNSAGKFYRAILTVSRGLKVICAWSMCGEMPPGGCNRSALAWEGGLVVRGVLPSRLGRIRIEGGSHGCVQAPLGSVAVMKRLRSGYEGNRVVNLWGVFCARVREFYPEHRVRVVPCPPNRALSRSIALSPASRLPGVVS